MAMAMELEMEMATIAYRREQLRRKEDARPARVRLQERPLVPLKEPTAPRELVRCSAGCTSDDAVAAASRRRVGASCGRKEPPGPNQGQQGHRGPDNDPSSQRC